MSVINKMLLDLDTRGMRTSRSDFSTVRLFSESMSSPGMPILTVLGVLLMALAGLAIWRFGSTPAVVGKSLAQLAAVAPVVALKTPVPPAEVVTIMSEASMVPTPLAEPALPQEPKAVAAKVADAVPEPRASALTASQLAHSLVKPERVAKTELASSAVERSEPRTRNALPVGSAAAVDNVLQMKRTNPRQEAENEYRRALGLVQEGRASAGISSLEQALRTFPRHDAARQVLIGLLLESRRPDDAMLQLEQGLALDPAQTAMAMTLARLQVERGGPALQTLQRSLPHAQDNADYHGFMAALLQREQRHKDAIEHFTSALRMNSRNGIWWMGLGISLRADQRLPDARVAFQKAKASGTLDGELPNFVDKQLQQMGY